MLYYDRVNSELREYFLILCDNDYPLFIEKYLYTKPLRRIGKVGQFCGCDYSKLYNIKYFYSRLDHSVACCLMAWHFTKDKTKTLMALFHDLGTPVFSHTIDYLLGDTKNQESSEMNVFDIISSSKEICNLLKEDNITIDDLKNAYKCSIIENERPKICVDRLDGVLQTALTWLCIWQIKDVKYIYKNLDILINENGEKEIGFTNLEIANYFFDACYKYSMVLQSNEDKYIMQFICDCIKILINDKVIKISDLYEKEESEIVDLLKEHIVCFNDFQNASSIKRSDKKPNSYYVSCDVKRRYVIPLCNHNGKNSRLNDISSSCNNMIHFYLKFNDKKYGYINCIKEIKSKVGN